MAKYVILFHFYVSLLSKHKTHTKTRKNKIKKNEDFILKLSVIEIANKKGRVINKTILFFVNCRPSTFAQAAKHMRLAAAKEKELANCEAICNSTHPLIFTHSTFLKLS